MWRGGKGGDLMRFRGSGAREKRKGIFVACAFNLYFFSFFFLFFCEGTEETSIDNFFRSCFYFHFHFIPPAVETRVELSCGS